MFYSPDLAATPAMRPNTGGLQIYAGDYGYFAPKGTKSRARLPASGCLLLATFETRRCTVRMSGVGGRPEVSRAASILSSPAEYRLDRPADQISVRTFVKRLSVDGKRSVNGVDRPVDVEV
jgi:hypothetical protein